MKTILLVRHAKSGNAEYNETDFERSLTNTGFIDAKNMAKLISDKNIVIDLMVTSTANRAATTCLHFATANNIHYSYIVFEDKLYNAPSSIFNKVISTLDNNINSVAIFGHNQGISEYASSLLNETLHVEMKPCSVFAVNADIKDWKDWETAEKHLLFFEKPSGTTV